MDEQCGWSCYDFLYDEACEIEDEVRCRYANWNETYERYEWWKVDIDECFTDEDWEYIRDCVDYKRDELIDWYIQYGHKVSIQIYWDGETPMSVTLEDENTNEIVLDAELYTLKARDDAE